MYLYLHTCISFNIRTFIKHYTRHKDCNCNKCQHGQREDYSSGVFVRIRGLCCEWRCRTEIKKDNLYNFFKNICTIHFGQWLYSFTSISTPCSHKYLLGAVSTDLSYKPCHRIFSDKEEMNYEIDEILKKIMLFSKTIFASAYSQLDLDNCI